MKASYPIETTQQKDSAIESIDFLDNACYTDSSMIIFKENSIHNLEEDIYNSMSDLKLDSTIIRHDVNHSTKTNAEFSTPFKKIKKKFLDPNLSLASIQNTPKKRAYIPAYKSIPYVILKMIYHFDGSHKHFLVLKAKKNFNTEIEDGKFSSAF